jgi:hypothetical protein
LKRTSVAGSRLKEQTGFQIQSIKLVSRSFETHYIILFISIAKRSFRMLHGGTPLGFSSRGMFRAHG